MFHSFVSASRVLHHQKLHLGRRTKRRCMLPPLVVTSTVFGVCWKLAPMPIYETRQVHDTRRVCKYTFLATAHFLSPLLADSAARRMHLHTGCVINMRDNGRLGTIMKTKGQYLKLVQGCECGIADSFDYRSICGQN